MLVECPHCLTRVWPDEQGICPACRKDTRDTRGTDPTRTRMKITPRTTLPAICFHCARPTDLTYRFARSQRTAMGDREAEKAALAGLLGLLAGILTFWHGDRETLVIELPICRACSEAIQPEPARVNVAEGSMTFIVHKEFKRQAEAT